MIGALQSRPERGSVLVLVLFVGVIFAGFVVVALTRAQVDARSVFVDIESGRALHRAYSEIAVAQAIVSQSRYEAGRNVVLREALASTDATLAGSRCRVEEVPSPSGTVFRLRSTVPYADVYEREVLQAVREVEYLSNYHLFVGEHDAGVSGQPRGAIHSNRQVEFHFPGGRFTDTVSAVEGFAFLSGASSRNTELVGPSYQHAREIGLEELLDEGGGSLASLGRNAANVLRFDADRDVQIVLVRRRDEQWALIEEWSRPPSRSPRRGGGRGDDVAYPVPQDLLGRRVVDYEEVPVRRLLPDGERSAVEDVREELFEYVTSSRASTRLVGIPYRGAGASDDSPGVGMQFTTATEQVIERVPAGHRTVRREVSRPVFTAVEYVERRPVFASGGGGGGDDDDDDERSRGGRGDRPPPATPTLLARRYVRIENETLIHVAGDVTAVRGDVVGRLTIVSDASISITGSIVYRDRQNEPAYDNGDQPRRSYEPNRDYGGSAALGLIALGDVIYSRLVPDVFEINASIAAVTGRVGIEGIELDLDGDVVAYNRFRDWNGRPEGGEFYKTSLRRLGALASAKRPVETLLGVGVVSSGFDQAESVYDTRLVASPPPHFLRYESPHFFLTSLLR